MEMEDENDDMQLDNKQAASAQTEMQARIK